MKNLQADLSDHCQISCMFKCNYAVLVDSFNYTLMSDKYIWDDKSPELVVEALNSPSVQYMVHKFKNKLYDKESVDDAAKDLNSIILEAADKPVRKKIKLQQPENCENRFFNP